MSILIDTNPLLNVLIFHPHTTVEKSLLFRQKTLLWKNSYTGKFCVYRVRHNAVLLAKYELKNVVASKKNKSLSRMTNEEK